MRIAVVHSFYSSAQPSGENEVVRDQLRVLREAGHETALVARHTDEASRRPLYALRAAATAATGFGATPTGQLATFQPDIVHVHNLFPNWGTRWLQQWGSRTVLTIHNYRSVCAAATLFRDGSPCTECLDRPVVPAVRHRCYGGSALASVPLALASRPRGSLRGLLSSASRLITLNHQARDFFAALGAPSVELVPNFVPHPMKLATTAPGEAPYWIYVGRLAREKGVLEMVRDWPRGEQLIILGDGPLRNELEELTKARPEVRFLGIRPRAEVLDWMAPALGLVIPSLWSEGLPTVSLESLSLGVPLVVSTHVAAGEDLSARGGAVRYSPEAPGRKLEQALEAVRRSGSALRTSARDLHATEYSPDVWLQRTESIYRSVLAQNHN